MWVQLGSLVGVGVLVLRVALGGFALLLMPWLLCLWALRFDAYLRW